MTESLAEKLAKKIAAAKQQAQAPVQVQVKTKEEMRQSEGTVKEDGTIVVKGFTKRLAERAEAQATKSLSDKFRAKLAALQKGVAPTLESMAAHAAFEEEVLDKIQLPDSKRPDIILDEFQEAALKGMRWQQFCCLIGAAGTGKTTVTKKLLEQLEETTATVDINRGRRQTLETPIKEFYAPAILICSFMGRAVQQIKRAVPEHYHPMCMTIHSALGFYPEYFDIEYYDEELKQNKWKTTMRFVPYFTATNKLPYKIIVVDESGTVPIDLWNQLIDACTDDVRFILIGDINQLPPVQGRSVLGFAMINWPTFTLEKIHRQAADNPIIANAHRILRGEMPQAVPGKFDMLEMPNKDIDAYNKMMTLVKLLAKKGQFDPIRDGFIVAMNDYQLGQRTFNELLTLFFNPPKIIEGVEVNPRTSIATGMTQVIYAIGDKVMILNNDRDLGLTNGMIGIVTEIRLNGNYDRRHPAAQVMTPDEQEVEELDMESFALELEKKVDASDASQEKESASQRQASHILTVKFGEDIEVKFQTAGEYRKITHAYAFTCHKSQGGEYPTVIVLCHSANLRLLSREWLYTSVTRAQNRVILCYNQKGLAQAIHTQRIKGKSIEEKAKSFIALQDKTDTNLPILWKAREIEHEEEEAAD